MNKIIGYILAAAAISAIVLSDKQVSDMKPIQVESKIGPSILHKDDKGNKYYLADVRQTDGGVGKRSVPPDCVRRRKGAPISDCMRRTQDGGSVDIGQLNRFPASEAVGSGCQVVACGVYSGQDSEQEE